MNDSIWTTIAETSFWVYLLICYVVYIGYLTSKQRTIPVLHLWLSMTSFIFISLACMLFFVKPGLTAVASWLTMFLLGSGLGWLHYNRLQVLHIADAKQLLIPGSWVTMVVMLAGIATKFYFGYEIALDPYLLKSGEYSQLLMTFYGLMTGLFIGRIAYARQVIKQAA